MNNINEVVGAVQHRSCSRPTICRRYALLINYIMYGYHIFTYDMDYIMHVRPYTEYIHIYVCNDDDDDDDDEALMHASRQWPKAKCEARC